jgi:hydroxymethylglutaryl-CoA lyase
MTRVRLTEVGPRDGLQNEQVEISTAAKIAFVDTLTAAGHQQIEVSSFVRPDRIPAMSDAEAVFGGISRAEGVRYIGLVANERGLERAMDAQCDTIAVFTAASSRFALANVGLSVDDSLERYATLTAASLSDGIAVRGYVSTIFQCPFGGNTQPAEVVRVARALLDMGCYEVSLGDTTGVGTPADVRRLLDVVVPELGVERIALHLHDTWGMAIANAMTGLDYGVLHFDASAGGLGGCPFAKGASGNLATEDILYMLDGLGYETGVALDIVATASEALADGLDHPLSSRVHAALMARRADHGGESC